MPVDFTNKNEKTNIQYLREILNMNMSDTYREEALEFLESVEKEQKNYKEKIVVLEKNYESLIDEEDDEESPDHHYSEWIETGMEPIGWTCSNLAIQGLMETFGNKLQKHGHVKLESFLNCLT